MTRALVWTIIAAGFWAGLPVPWWFIGVSFSIIAVDRWVEWTQKRDARRSLARARHAERDSGRTPPVLSD